MRSWVPDTKMTPADFRESREEPGLSVSRMAAELGVRPHSVERWQAGVHAVPGGRRAPYPGSVGLWAVPVEAN